jgi:hypothetical protein
VIVSFVVYGLWFVVCCLGMFVVYGLLFGMCVLARQNARSDRVCLDFSLLRFFVSRQRNEEER